LADYRGKRVVVLYFYGCTAEACAFRDRREVFAEAGAQVIAVSSDSVGSPEAFVGSTCACPADRPSPRSTGWPSGTALPPVPGAAESMKR